MITASRVGRLSLAPREEQTRSLDRGIILDTGLGLAHKLAAIYDTVKVRARNRRGERSSCDIQDLRFPAQHWRLTSMEAVTCPELGPELETFEKGEVWSHFRADTECLDSVEPVMTVFSVEHPEGE